MQQFGFEKGRACLFFSSPNNQRKQTGPELIKPGCTLVSLTGTPIIKNKHMIVGLHLMMPEFNINK